MTPYEMTSADQLYHALPEIYRNRDRSDPRDTIDDLHLRKYLGAMGHILDLTRHTLQQRYDDSFPDISDEGRSCQDWLIPYFADLLAVDLHSPYPNGQREEVANAVRWAQSKGTLGATEDIIEAITQGEGEIQEGWMRVATTARIGLPLLPALVKGADNAMPPDSGTTPENPNPQVVARHPGFRAITPDLRQHSRAIEVSPGHPNSQSWSGEALGRIWPADDTDELVIKPEDEDEEKKRIFWRQVNPHGAPCFPGTYQDISARTPDLRDPDMGQGGYHPKRLLIYLPPPTGLCPPGAFQFPWDPLGASAMIGQPDYKMSDFITRTENGEGEIIYRNNTAHSIEITDDISLSENVHTRFEKIRFTGNITMSAGSVSFTRCAVKNFVSIAPAASTPPRVIFQDCLVGGIKAVNNTVLCEYVTVLEKVLAGRLLASDCIFAGTMGEEDCVVNENDCVRYSRVSPGYFGLMPPNAKKNAITIVPPQFITNPPDFTPSEFCTPGCGVLSMDNEAAILNGAEDGAEIGAYHAWRYAGQIEALRRKLRNYLPVGIEPVIIRDATLNCKPPLPE